MFGSSHQGGRYGLLARRFHHLALEEGDYIDVGVALGTSFYHARVSEDFHTRSPGGIHSVIH